MSGLSGAPLAQASNTSQRIIPYPTDEKEVYFKLDGRNEVTGAFFVGWTSNILQKFDGMKPKFVIQSLPLKEICKIYSASYEWRSGYFVRKSDGDPVMKLADLCKQTELLGSFQLSTPTVVRVLEKQGLIVSQKRNDSVLIMGKIIIGDSTGFCIALMYNDSVHSIYNQVEVGDSLVIAAALVQKSKPELCEKVYMQQEKYLAVEFKFRMYEFKRVYLVQGAERKRVLAGVFPQRGTWLPFDLWNPSIHDFELPSNYERINLCGVISYVGSVFRIRAQNKTSDESRKSYYCFRWIQVVDRLLPKPLSIKLFLHNLNWNQQEHVVPGIAIVLTNLCKMDEKSDYFGFYLQSTLYSKVYINHDIAYGYLTPLPKGEREIIKEMVSRTRCSEVLQRKDVEWSAGGTLFLPIVNKEVFLQNMEELFQSEISSKPSVSKMDLVRREVQRVYSRGYIYKVFKVSRGQASKGGVTKLWWMGDVFPNFKLYPENTTQRADTFMTDYEKYWFAFPRKLLSVVKDRDDIFKTFEANKELNIDLCKPLLLPSKYPEDNKPSLRKLPVAGGDTYFIVWIADPYEKRLFSCMWKTFPEQVMNEKINEVKVLSKSKHVQIEGLKERKLLQEGENKGPENSDLSDEEKIEKSKTTSVFIIDLFKIEDDDLRTEEEHLQVSLVDFVHYDRVS